jgi:hypothetical protein
MPTDVYLDFDDGDHREAVVERLRALPELPDGQLIEDDEGVRLALDADDPNAALIRAHTLVRGALDGTDMDPDRVRKSLAGDWHK